MFQIIFPKCMKKVKHLLVRSKKELGSIPGHIPVSPHGCFCQWEALNEESTDTDCYNILASGGANVLFQLFSVSMSFYS